MGSGHFALVDDGNAVDQHIVHALGELIGIVEGCEVANGRGIEDRDVSPHAYPEQATAFEAQALGRQCGEFANGVFQRELMLFANVFAEDAWERSVRAGMRVLSTENSFRRNA